MTEPAQEFAPFVETTSELDVSSSGRWHPLRNGVALYIGDEKPAEDWAQKWMHRVGLDFVVASDPDDAISRFIDAPPNVVISEASAQGSDQRPLYKSIADELTFRNIPQIVLCQTARDAERAIDAGVADIVRKPVTWNLVARRAALLSGMAGMQNEIEEIRRALRRSEERAADSRRHITELSDTDALTGLPTLHKFRQILARALCQTSELALLFVGLERFHLVNEAHGRDIGDRVLEAVGARLRESLMRPELHLPGSTSVLAACVAKLDGVRFGMFVPHDGGAAHLQTIRHVLTDLLAEPINIDGRTIYMTSSIGGAVSPRDGNSAAQLLQNAERAMMTVKRRGGGFGFHSEDAGLSSSRLLELDRWLREALVKDELKVFYQPLVNLWNNRIVGAEALLRWRREDGKFISPGEFIPVAERSGFVVEIGDMVIDRACRELRRWMDAGHANQRMAINLSIIQLRRGDVRRSVEKAIDRYDLQPEQLEFEISERGAIGNDQRIVRQLHEIKSIGVRLSLDDFGTGDTAIEYLKRLPIDVLKLDRSYVAGALESGVDAVIASALVGLAKGMNLTVIAEGVELQEQHDLLRSWGCHLYQGYLCSPAVHGDAFMELLNAQTEDNAMEFGK